MLQFICVAISVASFIAGLIVMCDPQMDLEAKVALGLLATFVSVLAAALADHNRDVW
jgi:hypothetical protein